MAFIKNVEDFTCEHCGISVVGNGYTNHCPKCLWSKHVDVVPGDRMETCGGMMEPKAIEGSSPNYVIVDVCTKCRATRRIRSAPEDSTEAILAVIKIFAAKN